MNRSTVVHAQLQIAQALADETRLRLMTSLLNRDATVTCLAEELGLDQPRVSSHLAVLKSVGLVSVIRQGRQRIYSADHERGGVLLTAIENAAAGLPRGAASSLNPRGVRASTSLREARTCYDHLAGVAGVELLDLLIDRGFVIPAPTDERLEYRLTTVGETMLFARGVRIDYVRRSRRRLACACQDWTEGRPHIGGALGMALLQALIDDGIVSKRDGTRAVDLNGSIGDWLDETFKASIQAWSDGASDDHSLHQPMEEMS
jgi:DNA-binding transcriptional ArsR family regulator